MYGQANYQCPRTRIPSGDDIVYIPLEKPRNTQAHSAYSTSLAHSIAHQRFLEMTFATFPRYRCLFKAGKADRGKKEGACLIWKKDAGK